MNNLIIFDLDGVITSEEADWDAAGLTLYELCYSPRYWGLSGKALSVDRQLLPPKTAQESRSISRSILPETDILALKGRSINSNWDTCYVAVCLNLIFLLRLLPNRAVLLPLMPWDTSWLARFRNIVRKQKGFGNNIEVAPPNLAEPLNQNLELETVFGDQIFKGSTGLELINCLDAFAAKTLEAPISNVFSRNSPFWSFCRNIFQEWYLGDTLFAETYKHAPIQPGKTGCIYFEKPLLPLDELRNTLDILRSQNYTLGFATGRIYSEAAYQLKMYGLFEYFQEQHISTYDDVEQAEAALRSHGDQTLLGKPHPFPFLVAKGNNLTEKNNKRHSFIVIGDSTSDIVGGRAAGAMTVAVLTGTRTPEARKLLDQSNPDFTIADITKLPELLVFLDSLATIQQLQFKDRTKAELLLQRWLAQHMNIQAERVTLTPKAVSLNSFNGFYKSDGQEYFFKTHIEEQGILEEYYNAEQLFQVGYNIVRPLRIIHQGGQQMVIYPVVPWPVMFDQVRAVETGNAEVDTCDILIAAEKQESGRLLDIYQSTFAISTATEHSSAPIHQLFWHRLVGGRYKSFYEGKTVLYPTASQPQEDSIAFNELLTLHWVINGVPQQNTLGELVERARVVLDPAQSALTVIGHGDAHYGNVFFENQRRFLYFDPAFAGRHSPLLDVMKPLFHNVFATWMYFPNIIERELQLIVARHGNRITVENNYTLTPIRKAILQTKVEHLLKPLIVHMQEQATLPIHWKEIVQLALMCCPLLTINLLDRERMPTLICWLGLLQAVLIGNQGIQPWGFDL